MVMQVCGPLCVAFCLASSSPICAVVDWPNTALTIFFAIVLIKPATMYRVCSHMLDVVYQATSLSKFRGVGKVRCAKFPYSICMAHCLE